MSFANRHNKKGIDWGVNTEDFEYKDRGDLYEKKPDEVYTLRGFYINTKGRLDDHPVAILDKFFVDFPAYMTEEMREVLKSEEDVNDILKGKVGFKFVKFIDKNYGRTCYGVEWVDILEK